MFLFDYTTQLSQTGCRMSYSTSDDTQNVEGGDGGVCECVQGCSSGSTGVVNELMSSTTGMVAYGNNMGTLVK